MGCFVLLLGFNRALRHAIIPPAKPQLVMENKPQKEYADDGKYSQAE
jgi:hypothetical protein